VKALRSSSRRSVHRTEDLELPGCLCWAPVCRKEKAPKLSWTFSRHRSIRGLVSLLRRKLSGHIESAHRLALSQGPRSKAPRTTGKAVERKDRLAAPGVVEAAWTCKSHQVAHYCVFQVLLIEPLVVIESIDAIIQRTSISRGEAHPTCQPISEATAVAPALSLPPTGQRLVP
jgi:hypothetical protein